MLHRGRDSLGFAHTGSSSAWAVSDREKEFNKYLLNK